MISAIQLVKLQQALRDKSHSALDDLIGQPILPALRLDAGTAAELAIRCGEVATEVAGIALADVRPISGSRGAGARGQDCEIGADERGSARVLDPSPLAFTAATTCIGQPLEVV